MSTAVATLPVPACYRLAVTMADVDLARYDDGQETTVELSLVHVGTPLPILSVYEVVPGAHTVERAAAVLSELVEDGYPATPLAEAIDGLRWLLQESWVELALSQATVLQERVEALSQVRTVEARETVGHLSSQVAALRLLVSGSVEAEVFARLAADTTPLRDALFFAEALVALECGPAAVSELPEGWEVSVREYDHPADPDGPHWTARARLVGTPGAVFSASSSVSAAAARAYLLEGAAAQALSEAENLENAAASLRYRPGRTSWWALPRAAECEAAATALRALAALRSN